MRRNAAAERKNIGVVTVPLFQASSQILDGALLVICHPGNQDDGGEACDGLVYLSRTFADRNYHNRQKSHLWEQIGPDTERANVNQNLYSVFVFPQSTIWTQGPNKQYLL